MKQQKYDFISLLRGSSWLLLLPIYHFNSVYIQWNVGDNIWFLVFSCNHSKHIYKNLQYLYDFKWYLAIWIRIENNNLLSLINVPSLFLKQNTNFSYHTLQLLFNENISLVFLIWNVCKLFYLRRSKHKKMVIHDSFHSITWQNVVIIFFWLMN